MLELIFIALLIMLGWGIGDFVIAHSSKKSNPFFVNFWISPVQFVLMATVYFVLFFPKLLPAKMWPVMVAYSVIHTIAFLAFLKALQVGKVSLVSPIASGYGILAMALSLAFLRESLKATQYAGILITTAGLLLSIINFSELKKLRLRSQVKGLKYALIAFVAWGVAFVLTAFVVREVDWVTPFFFSAFISVPLAFFLMARNVKGSLIPKKGMLISLAFASVLLLGSWFLYTFSVRTFPSALLAPISAAYPAVTILLAHFFFKERMANIQYAGVGMILAGLVVAAL